LSSPAELEEWTMSILNLLAATWIYLGDEMVSTGLLLYVDTKGSDMFIFIAVCLAFFTR
jgi:hypothetical protein